MLAVGCTFVPVSEKCNQMCVVSSVRYNQTKVWCLVVWDACLATDPSWFQRTRVVLKRLMCNGSTTRSSRARRPADDSHLADDLSTDLLRPLLLLRLGAVGRFASVCRPFLDVVRTARCSGSSASGSGVSLVARGTGRIATAARSVGPPRCGRCRPSVPGCRRDQQLMGVSPLGAAAQMQGLRFSAIPAPAATAAGDRDDPGCRAARVPPLTTERLVDLHLYLRGCRPASQRCSGGRDRAAAVGLLVDPSLRRSGRQPPRGAACEGWPGARMGCATAAEHQRAGEHSTR